MFAGPEISPPLLLLVDESTHAADASRSEVYNRALTETGTFTTAAGATGNWRLEVRLENVTGTLNFRVQKP
jgi:hypothetical protein